MNARPTLALCVALAALASACGAADTPPKPATRPTGSLHTARPTYLGAGPAKHIGAGPVTVFFHGRTDRPEVALTFDSNMTPFMLGELSRGVVRSFDDTAVVDELIATHTPATFFLSGLWVQRYPQETRRIMTTPWFEVGSHSYLHDAFDLPCYGLAGLPAAQLTNDVVRSEDQLHHLDPRASDLFRFPGGCYDQAALRAVARARVQVVQYSDVSDDAFNDDVAGIVRATLRGLVPGAVVVMHITGGNTAPATASALPLVLRALRARHLRPVTVSQLMADQHA